MAYIGKHPVVGNFQVCDAISVVNGQAAYTLQVGGTNVEPESANHMLVSLNGILQKPGSSFTISGSTMTFASNLATGDVIDFVQILGNVLDLGSPSDDTVTAAKLNDNVISGQTALAATPDDTDELLISDGGTIKRIDFSHIKGGGKILATYQDTKTDTFTTTSSSHTDVTGLISPSITPASSSSKFIINVSIGSIANSTGNARAFIRVVRRVSSSDTVVLQGDAATGDETMMAFCTRNNDGQHAQHVMGFTVIDSPSTTSDVIYSVQVSRGADSGTVSINSAYTSTAERGNCASTIVVQEVSS